MKKILLLLLFQIICLSPSFSQIDLSKERKTGMQVVLFHIFDENYKKFYGFCFLIEYEKDGEWKKFGNMEFEVKEDIGPIILNLPFGQYRAKATSLDCKKKGVVYFISGNEYTGIPWETTLVLEPEKKKRGLY